MSPIKEIILFSLFLLNEMSNGEIPKNAKQDRREGKIFSLFNIVTFPNLMCVAKSDPTLGGTCCTASECNDKGGSPDGNCASGFGVCCMISISSCGSTVSQNDSYIQNPGFPDSYPGASPCSYRVSAVQKDICQLKLNFKRFELTGVLQTNVGPLKIGYCQDRLEVKTPAGGTPFAVCGKNTDLHMYIETGGSSSNQFQIDFTFTSQAKPTRIWKIKIAQIECWNPMKAPADCRQYFTGTSGVVKSFNYGNLNIQSLSYNICFRQEEGFCSVDFFASPDFIMEKTTTALTGQECASKESYLIIPNDNQGSSSNILFCGIYLSSVSTNVKGGVVRERIPPFTLGFVSSSTIAQTGTGFSLGYNQVSCN